MATVYPGTPPGTAFDVFTIPTEPEGTPLSSAGTSDRNHPELHDDIGNAIEALEHFTALSIHDHSGDPDHVAKGSKLAQVNTHESVDTDLAGGSIHHTIGPGGTQAAPGNHAHDYNSPFIFNKPLLICTTTTRPVDPYLGLMIWETDTNTFRVWSAFPGNTLVPGVSYTDPYSRVSNVNLGADYAQAYVTGASPVNGALATPISGAASWVPGTTNAKCRCIARSVASPGGVTDTDDQSIVFKTGSTPFDIEFNKENPTEDIYLRMSADSQSYVRLSLDYGTAQFRYTTSGPNNEKPLGLAPAGTWTTQIEWEAKAVGRTFVLYRGGVQILTVLDSENATRKGAANRGWGIGMTVTQGSTQQLRPSNIDIITVRDLPTYTATPIWQLLPVGATPYVRAETHVGQQISVGSPVAAFFDAILEDIFSFFGFGQIGTITNVAPSTDIVISEAGHYDVHASIPWDPATSGMDHGMVGFTVNGVDIGRKNWEFIRGNQYSPGFSQTNEIFIHWHFAAGDVLRVVAAHNAPTPCWLFASTATANKQVCYVDLKFTGP